MNIYANSDKNSFSYDWLRYKTNKWKTPSYSACAYVVTIPPDGYGAGKLHVKFNKMEPGVIVYLKSNSPSFSEIQILNSNVDYTKQYTIDNTK